MNGVVDHTLLDASDPRSDTQIRNNNIDRVVYALIAQVETFVAVGAITPGESRLAIDRLWNRWNGTPRATPATSPIIHGTVGRNSYDMLLSQLVGRQGGVPSASDERATTGYSTRPPDRRIAHLLDQDGTEDHISSHNPKHSLAGQFSVSSLNPECRNGSQHNIGGPDRGHFPVHHAAVGEDLIQLFDDEPSARAVPRSQVNPTETVRHVSGPAAEPTDAPHRHGHPQPNEQEPWSTDHWGPRRYELAEPPPPEFRVPMTAEARRNQEWRKMRLIPPGRLDAWELANLTPESAAIYKAYNEGKLPEGIGSLPPREDRPLQDPYWDEKNEEHVLNITSRGDALTSPSTASQDSVSSKVMRRREKAKARAKLAAEQAAEERAAAAAEALNEARERVVHLAGASGMPQGGAPQDMLVPEAAPPTVPETAVPRTAALETTAPETTHPEATAPETTHPEATAPKTIHPEATAPETTHSETTASETTAPETTAAETDTQERRALPDSVAADSVAADGVATKRAVPERAVPERAVSEKAVPEKAVPERAVQERAVPEEAVPERAVPERVVLDRNSFKRVPLNTTAPETLTTAGPSPSIPSGTVLSEVVPPTINPSATAAGTPAAANGSTLIVCPFWLTRPKLCSKYCDYGYIHELVPGAIQQRLECWFWANKGDCNKMEACQLEHRRTRHGHVMREPHFHEKKRKKLQEREREQEEMEMEIGMSPGRQLHTASNPWKAKSWRRGAPGGGAGEERTEDRAEEWAHEKAEERTDWNRVDGGRADWGRADRADWGRAERADWGRAERAEVRVEQSVERDDDKPELWDW